MALNRNFSECAEGGAPTSLSITLGLFAGFHITLKAPTVDDLSIEAPIRSDAKAG
jgi:hypothetical protein